MADHPVEPPEKIEILPVSLLDDHRRQVEELKALAHSLGIGLGWHYLLDWTWILSQLGGISNKRILDAGAGEGLLQWYLAGQGAEVLSVDRTSRAELSLRFRARYPVSGLAPSDLASPIKVWKKNINQAVGISGKLISAVRGAFGVLRAPLAKSASGRVIIHNGDLASMPLVADNSVDAVVAVSSLEHNRPENLPRVVDELMRVLKPGGLLLATLGASLDRDWLHAPSQGWCYTDASLRALFSLPADVPSNYRLYSELFSGLKNCEELRLNLADFYFRSGNNGMPWGKWDPQYQPVGIRKQKQPPFSTV
jgi:SAM-dependent methyltransferase